MDDNSHTTSNFTLYLILTICLIFVSLDAYELYKTCESWNYSSSIFDQIFFDNCVKFQIMSKLIFTIFSFLAAVSSVLITSCILINIDFFMTKFLNTYVQMNIMIFGPYLLGLSILGFLHWEKIFYVCENVIINSQIKRNFSTTIFINLIACFIISTIVTISFAVYKSFDIYTNSITSRRDGSSLLKSIFWKVVLKFRRREEHDQAGIENIDNIVIRQDALINEELLRNQRI